MKKENYLKPDAEELILAQRLHLLATLSIEGSIDDFEDGGEL